MTTITAIIKDASTVLGVASDCVVYGIVSNAGTTSGPIVDVSALPMGSPWTDDDSEVGVQGGALVVRDRRINPATVAAGNDDGHLKMFEHFLGVPYPEDQVTAASVPLNGFFRSGPMTGGTINNPFFAEYIAGGASLGTGTSTTGYASIMVPGIIPLFVSGATWRSAWRGRITASPSGTGQFFSVRFGMFIPVGAFPAAIIGFIARPGDTNWFGTTRGSGQSTYVDTGVAIDTAYHTFDCWTDTDGAAHFRVDTAAPVTITTTLPPLYTALGFGADITKLSGTSPRYLVFDWAYCEMPYTSFLPDDLR